MTAYALYLESGPMRRKTMVHVLDLLGCIANGPTTDAALAATPEAIRAFTGFLSRHGERVATPAKIETSVAEHITEGGFLGNGSPYIIFGPDREPLTPGDIKRYLARFRALREELAAWAAQQSPRALDAAPRDRGRTARAILLHVVATPGAYLSAALGGASGFSRVQTLAERGELPLPDALMRAEGMVAEVVNGTTPAQRKAVIRRPKGDVRTLRKALRRTLEHDWEHLAELSRRPGGPAL
jgi:predicted RNase H-like HicB family nuclease/uncharacterized damage-inducible protein DinB